MVVHCPFSYGAGPFDRMVNTTGDSGKPRPRPAVQIIRGKTGEFLTGVALGRPWARPPAGLSSMPTEQPTKRPLYHLHRDWGQRAEMRPAVSERYGRFASRVEGFRGWRAPSAGLSGGSSSRRVGGSAATRRNVA